MFHHLLHRFVEYFTGFMFNLIHALQCYVIKRGTFALILCSLLSNCSSHASQAPPPPQRAASLPAENSVDQGFQRFLNVLNKGVDVDLLRKIVNADSEDLCLDDKRHNIQQHEATDMSFRERPYSNDGNSLGDPSGREESSTDPHRQERSHSNPIPDKDEKKEEAISPFSFRTSAMRNNKEDEEKIKHDQQHEQLQNILKSLGLQLEKEEMSQLANRTQERLYGKKTDSAIAQSRRKPDRHSKGSPRSNRGSSSSSRSSCSSRSRSSSSSYCGSSRSNVSKRRSNESRARSSENLTGLENNSGTEKRLKTSNEDQQQSCAETQAWPPPNPSYSLSPLPDYTQSQYSQYSAYSASSYHNASSYWTCSQVPTHPSFYPSSLPYAQNQCHNFPVNLVEHPRSFPDQWQMAPSLDQQCLPIPQMKNRKWRRRSKKNKKNFVRWEKRAQLKVVELAEKNESAVEQQPALEEEGRVDEVGKVSSFFTKKPSLDRTVGISMQVMSFGLNRCRETRPGPLLYSFIPLSPVSQRRVGSSEPQSRELGEEQTSAN